MESKLKILAVALLLVFLLSGVSALTGNSSNVFVESKIDTGYTSGYNYVTSADSQQRYILGDLPVGQYASLSTLCGRLGVLGGNCTVSCGNGLIDAGEVCDDSSLNGVVCTPACGSTCSYCSNVCTLTIVSGSACESSGGGGGGGGNTGGGGGDTGGGTCSDSCRAEGVVESICDSRGNVGVRTCGNYDSDSCLEWSDLEVKSCGYESTCKSGSCVSLSCIPNYECGEWGKCTSESSADSVIFGSGVFGGNHQERVCTDLNGCGQKKIETQLCGKHESVKTKVVSWCNEDYVELTNPMTNELLGRVKQENILGFTSLSKIDIKFANKNFSGYCDYCYDGVKNFDEVEIDCGGPSCPKCVKKIVFFDWAFWMKLLLWIILFLLIILFYIEKKNNIWALWHSFLNRIKNIFDSAKFGSVEEIDLELKIMYFFRKIFKSKIKDKKQVRDKLWMLRRLSYARTINPSKTHFKSKVNLIKKPFRKDFN